MMFPKISNNSLSKSLSKLKEELWTQVSIYVRLSASVDGYCECYTCGAVKPWRALTNGIQAGHLFRRGRLATRFDLDNIRCQCYECNVIKNGNYTVFHKKAIAEMGLKKHMQLYNKSLLTVKLTRSNYETETDLYKEMNEQLAINKGIIL